MSFPPKTEEVTRIAIVGSTSPIGKDLRDLLADKAAPDFQLTLLDTDEYAGLLQEFRDQIQIVNMISPERLRSADIAVFACSPELLEQYVESGLPLPPLTIDLTNGERVSPVFVKGLRSTANPDWCKTPGEVCVAPRAEAIVLSNLLARLDASIGVAGSEATVLLPASESGRTRIEELQQHTIQALKFQPTASEGRHPLAFNVMGPDVESAARSTRVARQVGQLCGVRCPAPAMVFAQVPQFHGTALSIHIRLGRESTREEILQTLTSDGEAGFCYGQEQTTLSVAGSEKATITRIDKAADLDSFWIWIAADNIRVAARNAFELIRADAKQTLET